MASGRGSERRAQARFLRQVVQWLETGELPQGVLSEEYLLAYLLGGLKVLAERLEQEADAEVGSPPVQAGEVAS